MLTIKNLSAGYGSLKIIDNVSLEIPSGEIIGLIGPNGSGKSTLLKSIFNLVDIYSGKIVYEDIDITNMDSYKLVNLGIVYIPQGRKNFPFLTVRENLEIAIYPIKDKKDKNKNLNVVFNMFPALEERKNDYANILSGGQQQMLCMGRALMLNPKLLILDEPSLGLSPKILAEVFKKIDEIHKLGISILIVEQNINQLLKVANLIYVLSNGKIILSGDKELIKNTAYRIII